MPIPEIPDGPITPYLVLYVQQHSLPSPAIFRTYGSVPVLRGSGLRHVPDSKLALPWIVRVRLDVGRNGVERDLEESINVRAVAAQQQVKVPAVGPPAHFGR